MIIKQHISKFITYEISPVVYTFKDLSEVLSRGFKKRFEIRGGIQPIQKYDRFDSIIIENDNISMTTKLIVKFDSRALRFDEKSFLSTSLGFPPYWDYTTYDEYFSEKKLVKT